MNEKQTKILIAAIQDLRTQLDASNQVILALVGVLGETDRELKSKIKHRLDMVFSTSLDEISEEQRELVGKYREIAARLFP